MFDPEDTNDFIEIYNRYEKYVYKIAKYFTKDHHYAEDASQEAFKSIAKRIGFIKELTKDNQKVYVYKIAKNCSLRVMRKNKMFFSINELTEEDNKCILTEIEKNDVANRVKHYISNMEQKYRDVLSFYLIYGMTFKEISELMQIPLSTVQTRFYKGKDMILENFKEEGYDG